MEADAPAQLPPEGVTVRPARRDDLPAILELLAELDGLQRPWRVFPPRSGFGEEVAARFRSSFDKPDLLLVVAMDGEEVVGTAYGHVVVPSFFSDEAAVELSGVYVKPSHRGRGAGSLLAREVARFARRLGLARVTLKTFAANEEALRFWQGLGFEPRMVQLTALAEDLATGQG
jgi:ribosomal protein S18 acetylase RimI-like enzyme